MSISVQFNMKILGQPLVCYDISCLLVDLELLDLDIDFRSIYHFLNVGSLASFVWLPYVHLYMTAMSLS